MQPAGTGEGGWLPLLRRLRLVEVQLSAAYEEQKWAPTKTSEANPQVYITDLLTCMVNEWPQERIDEVMSWLWEHPNPH